MMFIETFLDSANNFPGSGFENLAKDASFMDRLVYGLKICGIGMIVVFLVLVFLWFILYCSKFLNNKNAKKETLPGDEAAPATVSAVTAVPGTSTVSAADSIDEQTVVVVATAAITASRNAKDAAFKVISVKKI